MFDTLEVWRDEQARTGAENMAVDQLLAESMGACGQAVLRVYDWSEPTVSFGYFLALDEAKKAFPATADSSVHYVRRWTGGGIVDHRIDLTYTLVIPRAHALSMERGAESYRQIHQALADTLTKLGEDIRLTPVDEGTGGLACFTNPVAYDLVNKRGDKMAGAGQRRSRYGLLHQGSLVTDVHPELLASELATRLANTVRRWSPEGQTCQYGGRGLDFFSAVEELAAQRYSSERWLTKQVASGG